MLLLLIFIEDSIAMKFLILNCFNISFNLLRDTAIKLNDIELYLIFATTIIQVQEKNRWKELMIIQEINNHSINYRNDHVGTIFKLI